MYDFKRKVQSRSGFTMVELLIVVAIIAVLVTVSIPMMTSVLDRARCAVDAANERAAIGLASSARATGAIKTAADDTPLDSTNGTYLYRVDDSVGSLVKWHVDFDESGNPVEMEKGDPYGQCQIHGHQGKYLWVQVLDNGIRLAWKDKAGGTSGFPWNKDLCEQDLS